MYLTCLFGDNTMDKMAAQMWLLCLRASITIIHILSFGYFLAVLYKLKGKNALSFIF